MQKILAVITTIVIAVGLAITGVSTATAADAVAPVTPATETTSAEIPAATEAPPTPAPRESSATTAPAPAPSPIARVAAALAAKSATPTPSASPIRTGGKCIPASAVSYTYAPSTNSGTVSVVDQPYSNGRLCKPIYITATSWKYTKAAVWPQVLDTFNALTVDKVGTYAFGAAVTCGQGDIYAGTDFSIVPTPTLQGSQKWEKFLSGLGLKTTTPGDTYVQSPITCVQSVPAASIVAGECYWDNEQGSSLKTVTVQYDNRKSNVPVDFSIQGDSASIRTVGSGMTADVTASESRDTGASYTVLAAGTKTTLAVAAYESCPPKIVTLPLAEPAPVTFVDTCGVKGDRVIIPSLTSDDHFSFSTSDSTSSAGVRTVTVTAVPDEGYGFGSDAVTVRSHTFKSDAENNCVTVPGDPEAVAQKCSVSSDGVVSGYLTVAEVEGVVYTIHPVTPTGANITVTARNTEVAPGVYLITATAKPGFILSGVTEWERTVADEAVDCSLPDFAALPSSVTWVSQTCSAGGTVSGFIAIDPTDFLSYFVGTTQLVSARTAFAPGTYVVTVVAPLGDTIDGPTSYTATIDKPSTSCGNLASQSLTTLAFTGFDSGSGYLAVASALLMLGAGLVFTARRKAKKA